MRLGNLLTDCGIYLPTTQEATGDPGVLSYVASNANSIGYASDGLARTTSGIGTAGIVPFDGVGQAGALPQVTGSNYAYGAVVPTTGSTGTIAGGIQASSTVNNYAGWRPFEYVTLQPPTGEVERYINFVMDPANNQNFATESAEVSVYSI